MVSLLLFSVKTVLFGTALQAAEGDNLFSLLSEFVQIRIFEF